MKYTIEGFSQEYALSLIDKVPYKKDKTKEIRLDFADLVLLRWFVDYYPKTKKYNIDGEEYGFVAYSKVIADLPLLNINKRGIADRFQKLCHFKILKYELVKKKGTFTLYTFGENYINLVDNACKEGCGSTDNGGSGLTDRGVVAQPTNKDISIKDNSISKEINKESDERIVSAEEISKYFDKTYEIYPKKVDKVQAKTTYEHKLRGLLAGEAHKKAVGIYRMLEKQIAIWNEYKTDWQYIKSLSHWLNANCEDSPHFKRGKK